MNRITRKNRYQFEFKAVPAKFLTEKNEDISWSSEKIKNGDLPQPGFMGNFIGFKEMKSGSLLQYYDPDRDNKPSESTEQIWGNEEKNCLIFEYDGEFLGEIICHIDLRSDFADILGKIIGYFSQIGCAAYCDEKVFELTEENIVSFMENSEAKKYCTDPEKFLAELKNGGENTADSGGFLDRILRIVTSDKPLTADEDKIHGEYAAKLSELGICDEDIKFFSIFGGGAFNDYFVLYDLLDDTVESVSESDKEAYLQLKENWGDEPLFANAYRFEYYPGKNGVFAFANCDSTMYRIKLENGKFSSVIIHDDSDNIFEYKMTVTEFMFNMFCGKIPETGIDPDMFGDGVFYEKYDDTGEPETPPVPVVGRLNNEHLDNFTPERERAELAEMGVPAEDIDIFVKMSQKAKEQMDRMNDLISKGGMGSIGNIIEMNVPHFDENEE